MSTTTKDIFNILWFIVVYFLTQLILAPIVGTAVLMSHGMSVGEAFSALPYSVATNPQIIIALSIVSNVVLILLFTGFRWTPVSFSYLQSRPWGILGWVIWLSLATIIPSIGMIEWIDADVPDSIEKMLNTLMKDGYGYLAVGILAPVAEEIIFRGAILRSLLRLFSHRWHWLAIGLSAVLFGLVHGNMAQAPHAVVLGLLLGWMYYRTNSIIPGLILHWVNNSVVFALCQIWPDATDLKLIDMFGGNVWAMWTCVVISLLFMIPPLLRLSHLSK